MSEDTTTPTIGLIGLGKMGTPMGRRLLEAGYDLRVFDAFQSSIDAFTAAHGGVACTTASEAVVADGVLVAMLPSGRDVREVVYGLLTDSADPLARLAGGAFVDMSSSDPTGTVELGELLGSRGVGMIDAPVSGGVARAETGELSIFVGGDAETYGRVAPILDVLGKNIWQVGRLGAGHALKALNNLMSATGLLVATEAMLVGARFGLDPETMLAAINASTGRNNSTENKFAAFVLSRSFDAGFSSELMLKDLRTAVKLAHDTDTPSPLASLVTELWAVADGQLGPGVDHTAVVQWLEDLTGTRLETDDG